MTIAVTPCECAGPGFCPRHKIDKPRRLWELCRSDIRYFNQWESGRSPQHIAAAATECYHRGEQDGEVDCLSCGKSVKLKVFACDLHGRCTIGTESPGIQLCATCPDKEQYKRTRVVIQQTLSPGDTVVLTAAVKALHDAHPGKYLTDVRTPCPALWENSPHVQGIPDGEEAIRITADHPEIHESDKRPVHFVTAACRGLADKLGLTPFDVLDWRGPSIWLDTWEKTCYSQVQEITGKPTPFWLINAGVKSDYTTKRWLGYQAVVNLTGHWIRWVQVGESSHDHPPLDGVIDLRGKTDLRQLVRLVYHSSGVLTGVSLLMHLAHWVERGPNSPFRRHAIVIAGGREPASWSAYPGQHFLHTIGELDCCAQGGCWKSRVHILEDGSEQDKSICPHPRGEQGLCMEMVTPDLVVELLRRMW